eukprot:SAG22_NODE_635_length_8370_cov_33.081127_4_plen_172_part_00
MPFLAVCQAAKVLDVDGGKMEQVAEDWIEGQTGEFERRVANAVRGEAWQPVAEEQGYAPAALDIVSMLMQVSKGYFMAELPVSQKVMILLSEKVSAFPCGPPANGTAFLCCSLPSVVVPTMQFGFLLQLFARLVEQQCGPMPSLEARSGSGGGGIGGIGGIGGSGLSGLKL